jgi:predicted dithiol-disulfide oxidoreductase (DUF899 family)
MNPVVVDREAWLEARLALLAREKSLTRLHDEVARQRREMPWVEVTKPYRFAGPDGEVSLVDLFEGRRQLVIQHFMFPRGWEEGCVGCSFMADHIDATLPHVAQRDVSFAAVSRNSVEELSAFKKRMGWSFRWVSCEGSDFNFDFGASFRPEEIATGQVTYNYATMPFMCEDLQGLSVFVREDDGRIFHAYSNYARGTEALIGSYMLLDLTPFGRNESGPNHDLRDWVRHHDRYATRSGSSCCHGPS